jgi:hypothetical protein
MNPISVSQHLDTPERLDEDLQIVHATLAAIVDDVQQYSGDAGRKIAAAMDQVHAAHDELVRVKAADR